MHSNETRRQIEAIENRKKLEKWLERRPIELSRLIAVKSALRVFPIIQNELRLQTEKAEIIAMTCFRTIYVAIYAHPPAEERQILEAYESIYVLPRMYSLSSKAIDALIAAIVCLASNPELPTNKWAAQQAAKAAHIASQAMIPATLAWKKVRSDLTWWEERNFKWEERDVFSIEEPTKLLGMRESLTGFKQTGVCFAGHFLPAI